MNMQRKRVWTDRCYLELIETDIINHEKASGIQQ